MTKHTTPLWCRIRRRLTRPSPSAVAWCYLGLRHRTRRCEGCKNNAGEQMHEAFQRGMEAGRAYLEKLKQDGHPFVITVNAVDLSYLETRQTDKKEGKP